MTPLAAQMVPGGCGIEGLRRLSGGASQQTWAFDVPTNQGVVPLILRRAVDTGGLGIGLEVEARLIEQAGAAGVPVPRVRFVLRPEHGLGDGFVMDRIAGETLGARIVRDERFAPAREHLAEQCGRALARIHGVDAASLPPLRYGPATVEIDFWQTQHRNYGVDKPVYELAFQWLSRHAPPAPERAVLVHGDFRNGNLMVDEDGLRAVLDWELAHQGDPMEDLGWICVNAWRFGQVDQPVGGFGTREQLFAGYEAEGGHVDVQRVHYWEVLGTLKWGIICEGMAHAWLSGRERNMEKAVIGRRASEADIDLLALLTSQGQGGH